jgi:transcriptional regulator
MVSRQTPLLRGTLELIVLQMLRAEPTNGYDLTQRIRAVSREVLKVNAGSLYPALYRLEAAGLVKGVWRKTGKGQRAKVYSVTAEGRRERAVQRESWESFSGALSAILRVT